MSLQVLATLAILGFVAPPTWTADQPGEFPLELAFSRRQLSAYEQPVLSRTATARVPARLPPFVLRWWNITTCAYRHLAPHVPFSEPVPFSEQVPAKSPRFFLADSRARPDLPCGESRWGLRSG
jgi:hypothetical protein